jgi:cysteine desulfurase family protein (TIGR01976 family)
VSHSHHEGEQILDVTIEAVRDRFHTLNVPLAYFDGPAGTQVPDSVLEAVSGYMLAANANAGGKFLTSMVTDDVIASARAAASDLLGVMTDEVTFGANMTSLNFHLSRVASRDWAAGDEVVVTKLDHDANVSPWLEIAEDKGALVKLAEIDAECRIDLDHLRSVVTERTKVVAFPMASNAVGTITPVKEIVEIAHSVGALAWVDAVHAAPHMDIEIPELGCDVLLCSPYKFFGPHLGLAWVRREVSEGWRPYKVRPQSDAPGQRHETGTLPHELLCGFVACVEYLHGVGWKFISEHERKLGQKFLDGLPEGWTLHGPPTMEGRVSTFCLSPPDESPSDAAARLGAAGFAVWDGNYYALEVFKHLGLPDGAIRIGIVHYTMEDEVDRLLAAMPRA